MSKPASPAPSSKDTAPTPAPGANRKKLVRPTLIVNGAGSANVKSAARSFAVSVRSKFYEARVGWDEVTRYVPKNPAQTAFDANPAKNRWPDIPCLDATRVKLTPETKDEGDYIHANWCELPDGPTIIATQAPLENTMGDFWRMCWEHEVVNIVQICKPGEGQPIKCAAYWPENPDELLKIGRWRVENKKTEMNCGFNTLTIELRPEASKKIRTVRIVQYPDWPEKAVPSSYQEILRLLRVIGDPDVLNPGLTVMHCLAGIGRTGTMILTLWTLNRLYAGEKVQMFDLLRQLRDQRAMAVQNERQLMLVYLCCLEYITRKGSVDEHETRDGMDKVRAVCTRAI